MAIKFLSNESIDGTLEVGTLTLGGSSIVAAVGMTLQVDAGSVNAITIDNVGTVTTSGYLKIPNYLFHDGNTDTFLQFGTDTITLRGDTSILLDGPVTANESISITGNLTASRLFSGDGGNKTNPMIANGSDQNTGIFFPAADTMAFTAGDAEALRFAGANSTFAGNILMGNTVVNPASGFTDQTGIGLKYSTTVPQIQVSSDSTAMELGRTSTGGDGQIMALRYASNTIHSFNTNSFSVGTNATFAGNVTVGANTVQNGTNPGLKIQSTNISQTVLGLHNTTSGNWEVAVGGSANTIGAGKFYVYDNTAGDSRLVIDTSGNVGIGVNDPTEKLTIVGSSSSPATSGTGVNGILAIESANGNSLYIGSYTASPFGCWLQASNRGNQAATYPIILNPNGGNVGIGVTVPGVQLEVGKSATIGAGSVSTSTTNHENVLKVKGKNNYSDGTTWYGDYGQILLSADSNMTGSAHQFLITNALDNNKFAIVRSTDANTVPVVNSTANGVNSGTADFVIDGAGNVGIGTTSPDSKLHVKGISTLEETTAGAGTQLKFVGQDNSGQFNFLIGKQYNVNNAFEITPSTVANGGVFTNPAFLVNSAGKVGIGTTSPGQKLHVNDGSSVTTTDANNMLLLTRNNHSYIMFSCPDEKDSGFHFHNTTDNTFVGRIAYSHESVGDKLNFRVGNVETMSISASNLNVTGTITASGDVVAYSDKRLKSNIKTLDGSKVYKMRGVSFIKDNKKGSGVIAQEMQKIAPELVNDGSEYLGVAYGNLSGYLIEAIKELKAEIEGLKNKPCACNNCNCKE